MEVFDSSTHNHKLSLCIQTLANPTTSIKWIIIEDFKLRLDNLFLSMFTKHKREPQILS